MLLVQGFLQRPSHPKQKDRYRNLRVYFRQQVGGALCLIPTVYLLLNGALIKEGRLYNNFSYQRGRLLERGAYYREGAYYSKYGMHITSLVTHTTLNTYKLMKINIERSPQH